MTDPIVLEVHGIPAPQGSKKGFVVNGRAVLTESAGQSLRTWRQDVIAACHAADGGPFAGPVHVQVTFWLPRPKTVRRDWPVTRPDLDKLIRATFDALKVGQILDDDAQVVILTAAKHYLPNDRGPGATITVGNV